MNITLSPLNQAIQSLQAALVPPPANDRERDGAIQRFEYTFELTWMAGKKVLELYGITSTSPRNVIRDLAQQGWIASAEAWLAFLAARNATTHTYEAKTAEEVFLAAQSFLPEVQALAHKLQELVHSSENP